MRQRVTLVRAAGADDDAWAGQTLISSVQRALKLVDIVANAARPLPVKAIAHASGLSLGTTYNIIRTLMHEGHLAAEPDGMVLGLRFPALRPDDEEGVFLARTRQTLRQVTEELGATAYLSRFGDGEVQIITLNIGDQSSATPGECPAARGRTSRRQTQTVDG